MAGDVIMFVDSVASSPTTRLDLNDQTTWAATHFDAPPPRIRRSVSSNLLAPGGNVGASVADLRVLTITLECITTSQDLGATEMQKLARELDRETNYVKYQPVGATKPVFFKTYRSDVSAILDMVAAKTFRAITIELLADPYALGLQETIGPTTINNDPASGTTPCSQLISSSTIIGDVPAPVQFDVTMNDATNIAGTALPRLASICPVGSGYTAPTVYQFGTGDNWTNVTGLGAASADATYSGGSYRTITAGASMTTICKSNSATLPAEQGLYKVMLRVKRSDATSTFAFRFAINSDTDGLLSVYGDTVNFDPYSGGAANAAWVDLGTFQFAPGVPAAAGITPTISLALAAQRTAGTGTVNADCIMAIPVELPEGEATTAIFNNSNSYGFGYTATTIQFILRDDAQNFAKIGTSTRLPVAVSGASPLYVFPGYANMVHLIKVMHSPLDLAGISDVITQTSSLTIKYYPRYLYVRPSAT